MMYRIGQRVPQFKGSDGVFLSIDPSGVMLLCRMDRPTVQERKAFQSGKPVNIGMCVLNNILVWTVGFGNLETMDCTFSPQVEKDPPVLEEPEEGKGYALTVILADASNGEILKLRVIGLPHDFSVQLKRLYDCIRDVRIDYQTAINGIYMYSTKELDDMATARCLLMGG